MMAIVASLLPSLAVASASLEVRVTPCADNSFRLQVFTQLPPPVVKSWTQLNATLASEGLTELPGAFVGCAPSTSTTLSSKEPSASHGNLKVTLTAEGRLSLTRVDTGGLYATATPTFSEPPPLDASCKIGALSAGSDLRVANVTMGEAVRWCAASSECIGFTTRASDPDTCASVAAHPHEEDLHEVWFKGDGAITQEDGAWLHWSKPLDGYLQAGLELSPGDVNERIYGLGQTGFTKSAGCPSGEQKAVPLARNGQTIDLLQTKFAVAIPVAFSSAGYGVLFHMPGYGSVSLGAHGVGGMQWNASAAIFLDAWVTGVPAGTSSSMAALHSQYAVATGRAPMLREEAMLFWQSRNRYKSSQIALNIAKRYSELHLPVGVLVVDYKNMHLDGDFMPDPSCYPDLSDLTSGVRSLLNASVVFSFWPEVKDGSKEHGLLLNASCLINGQLGGHAIDSTRSSCRKLVWNELLLPRYYKHGITAFWLDETDGEGTLSGYDAFAGGYATQYGPRAFASNLWVNEWISIYTDPVQKLGEHVPLVLTRGVWAGGARHGVVLWSSDIQSNFETLAAMVPQGVHASMSGIPWWTTDVGGYGCNFNMPNDSPYMQELIVRWYQFGLFCPVFRTHGCRQGPSEPDADPCHPQQSSCGYNEVWSYGPEVQSILSRYVVERATRLLPYIRELAANVSAHGVPTMRPLAYEFPADEGAVDINDQYMLGPALLVAPVTTQNATGRSVYFPCEGAAGSTRWASYWDASLIEPCGPTAREVSAPIDTIPVYVRLK